MNRELWLYNYFTVDSVPKWYCPSCNTGLLVLEKDKFHYEETAESRVDKSHPHWDFEWIRYRFNGILRCSSPKCKEMVVFAGDGSPERGMITNNSDGTLSAESWDDFSPKYFNPPLNIFDINRNCPEEIATAIYDSFGLYWYDESSCANKIRIVVETIMNQQRIRKTSEKNGSRLNLHKRIELFEKKKPDIAEHLLAIKFIGNDGSHVGEIEQEDLIDAYTLLEYSIEKLYDDREAEVKRLTKEIINKKGARSQSKKRF